MKINCDLKAKEKRCVFSLDLKISMDWADRMERGRWFQSEGAAAAKERSPLVLLFVVRTVKSSWSADLRALDGV